MRKNVEEPLVSCAGVHWRMCSGSEKLDDQGPFLILSEVNCPVGY